MSSNGRIIWHITDEKAIFEALAARRGFADKSGGAVSPPSARRLQSQRKEPKFGARALLFRMAGVDLTVIEGISETTALVILSEKAMARKAESLGYKLAPATA